MPPDDIGIDPRSSLPPWFISLLLPQNDFFLHTPNILGVFIHLYTNKWTNQAFGNLSDAAGRWVRAFWIPINFGRED